MQQGAESDQTYTTIYSTVKLLVESGQSGILKLYSKKALGIISFSAGRINGLKVGKYTGANAAKILAKWINCTTNFLNDGHFSETLESVDTKSFLKLILKNEKLLHQIKPVVSRKNTIFYLNTDQWLESSLTNTDQQVTMAVDGESTVEEIAAKTGIPEFELLKSIYKLYNMGMLYSGSVEAAMSNENVKIVLNSLSEILIDTTGAAAQIIIQRVLDKINFERNSFKKSQIPDLTKAINTYLEDDEKIIMKKWERNLDTLLVEP